MQNRFFFLFCGLHKMAILATHFVRAHGGDVARGVTQGCIRLRIYIGSAAACMSPDYVIFLGLYVCIYKTDRVRDTSHSELSCGPCG